MNSTIIPHHPTGIISTAEYFTGGKLQQLDRINSIGFKGLKINISDKRVQHSLKNKVINYHNKHNQFLNNISSANNTYSHFQYQQMIDQLPQGQDQSQGSHRYTKTADPMRNNRNNRKTNQNSSHNAIRNNIQTADASYTSRRRVKQIQDELIMKEQSKTMFVTTQNNLKNDQNKKTSYFRSDNLNYKMNQFMNMFIRQPPNLNVQSPWKGEGMITNKRKLRNSFIRKSKTSNKKKRNQANSSTTFDNNIPGNTQSINSNNAFKQKQTSNNLIQKINLTKYRDNIQNTNRKNPNNQTLKKLYHTLDLHEDKYQSPLVNCKINNGLYTNKLLKGRNKKQKKNQNNKTYQALF